MVMLDAKSLLLPGSCYFVFLFHGAYVGLLFFLFEIRIIKDCVWCSMA